MTTVTIGLSRIHQISVRVHDVDRATRFYRDVLGVPFVFAFPPRLAFFDCAGVRLMLEKGARAGERCEKLRHLLPLRRHCAGGARIGETRRELQQHLIAKMDDHDLWMAFFTDPDGHTLALMQEAPKGYVPPA